MSSGEKYLAAAYVVVLVAILAYVAIISLKLSRLERDVDELAQLVRSREHVDDREELPVG
jgi:CcmD family protein